LAAILAIDVAGYSRLMGEDQEIAVELVPTRLGAASGDTYQPPSYARMLISRR
jgi:hypothetical protein